MDVAVSVIICFFSALAAVYSEVPPDVCFQQFNWEDCGMPPKAVIYYYKSGSRCEVGFWRGCQPNPNMFADEYDCVQTCIFSLSAKAHDYHQFQDNVIEDDDTTAADNGVANAAGDGTMGSGNSTGVEEVEGGTTDAAGVGATDTGPIASVEGEEGGAIDAGANDAGANDAGANDAGANDAGANDAGANDAGANDADAKDAGEKK